MSLGYLAIYSGLARHFIWIRASGRSCKYILASSSRAFNHDILVRKPLELPRISHSDGFTRGATISTYVAPNKADYPTNVVPCGVHACQKTPVLRSYIVVMPGKRSTSLSVILSAQCRARTRSRQTSPGSSCYLAVAVSRFPISDAICKLMWGRSICIFRKA